MASQQPSPPAVKSGGGNLWSRMIAGAAGAALGAVVAQWLQGVTAAWGGFWFGPLCAGLGAIVGMMVDHYLLSGGKDDLPPS